MHFSIIQCMFFVFGTIFGIFHAMDHFTGRTNS